MNVVLKGGPFDGEGRTIPLDGAGCPPERIRLLDSVATMSTVLDSAPGVDVPMTYQSYRRNVKGPTGAEIWLYEYEGSYPGRFSIGESAPE
jgi:hypothetical protein